MESTSQSIITSLEEITLKKDQSDSTIFNEYVDKIEIGKKIFKELNNRIVGIDDEKKGFVMSDSSQEIGILSQCQSLQALVSLALDFGLDFDNKNIVSNQKGSIRELMDAVIEDIIPRILVTDENGETVGFVFDASPYDSNHYSTEYSNIDAITWVIPSFFSILKYHASIHEVCKWEDKLIAIIKHGLKYINSAFINSTNNNGGKEENSKAKKGLSMGWNFTKDCEEPSLYFTFTVGECYLDMYNTFKKMLEYLEAERNFKRYRIPIAPKKDDDDFDYNKKEEEYRANINKPVEKELAARYDEYNELVRIYRRINDIDDLDDLRIENTLYGDLEANCLMMAQEVWKHVKNNLADNFFYNDLNTLLTEKDIRMSTTSDALFNTVYIVNIMIDGGLDDHFDTLRKAAIIANNSAEAEEYQRAYDNLLESCQLAVQKAFRTYESLKNSSKDYIVDQFLIGFNEEFTTHKRTVNELRKLRMKTFSLLPLLIHTNNVISEYLIKYPQYNMKKYLEYILDNRFTTENTVHWIWEKDGYFSGSNYYYVAALSEFYVYYENYEKEYIKSGRKNAEQKKRIRAEYDKELKAPGGQIANLEGERDKAQDDVKKRDAKITKLEEKVKELEQYKSPVENEIKAIVDAELEKKFAYMLADAFDYATKALTRVEIDDTQDPNGVYKKVCSSMCNMVLADILSVYFSGETRRIKGVETYNNTKTKLEEDLAAVIAGYISNITNSTNNISKLRRFFD